MRADWFPTTRLSAHIIYPAPGYTPKTYVEISRRFYRININAIAHILGTVYDNKDASFAKSSGTYLYLLAGFLIDYTIMACVAQTLLQLFIHFELAIYLNTRFWEISAIKNH